MTDISIRFVRALILCAALGGLCAATAGCGGDEEAKKDEADALGEFGGPGLETAEEDGFIVERYTLDDDDEHDVVKYFEEYPDPDDESITKRRMRKKEVDVNSDGEINIVRAYDKEGTLTKEKLDADLDGQFDLVNHFDNGEIVKKERISEDGSRVVEVRHYSNGEIARIERDRDQDGDVDYWEFYEQGTLDRIGRDLSGDGKADSWTNR